MKLIQNSEISVYKAGILQKSPTVDIMPWIHFLGPLKRISSEIGPGLQSCRGFEKLGIFFDMKLIQNKKYKLSNRGSYESLPLWILLEYTPKVPQEYLSIQCLLAYM